MFRQTFGKNCAGPHSIADHQRIYVRWPQEACFIGPNRRRVKYDQLTQSQWTAGLTTLAAEEPNPVIQKNMFLYLSALLRDVCDFSVKSALGLSQWAVSTVSAGVITLGPVTRALPMLPMIFLINTSVTFVVSKA